LWEKRWSRTFEEKGREIYSFLASTTSVFSLRIPLYHNKIYTTKSPVYKKYRKKTTNLFAGELIISHDYHDNDFFLMINFLLLVRTE
jgi:hypothetical protein